MPPRKKAKTEQPGSDGAQDQKKQRAAIDTPLPESPPEETEKPLQPATSNIDQSIKNGTSTPKPTTSWYSGTWPRTNKSNPVTQVAKESIPVAGNVSGKVSSDVVASTRASNSRPPPISSPLRSPASYLSRGATTSTRSLPLAAAPTKLNITSSASDAQDGTAADGLRKQSNTTFNVESKPRQHRSVEVKEETPVKSPDQNDIPISEPPSTLYSQRPPEEGRPANESVSWLSWFTKADNAGTKGASRPQSIISPQPVESPPSPNQRRNSEPNPSSPPKILGESSRPWLGNWGSTAKGTAKSPTGATEIATEGPAVSDKQMPDKNAADVRSGSQPSDNSVEAAKSHGYGWAFWSLDASRDMLASSLLQDLHHNPNLRMLLLTNLKESPIESANGQDRCLRRKGMRCQRERIQNPYRRKMRKA